MSARFVMISAALLLAVGGCLKVAPGDGLLQCAAMGQKCPDGYHCANNNTCWHIGKDPDNADLGMAGDMHVSGDLAGADLAAPDMTQFLCGQSTDCPATNNPCTGPYCALGLCSPVPSPAGILLPDQSKYVGTCTALACDGNGNTAVSPAPINLPFPPSACYTTSCGGAQGNVPAEAPR